DSSGKEKEVKQAPTIRLRCRATNFPTEVLYVLNNEVVDPSIMGQLQPNNIQSITILKDNAAAALYGVRGSQGAILITTKPILVNVLILDESRKIIPGATISIHRAADKTEETLLADSTGLSGINLKASTNYQLKISSFGFETVAINLSAN